jgi:ankyrin repeat protein
LRPAPPSPARFCLTLALLLASAAALPQHYSPADQEKLRKAGLPLLPSALPNAAALGNVDLVSKFLAAGISTELRDSSGRTPLLLAMETSVLEKLSPEKRAEMVRNKLAVARLLVQKGADVRTKSNFGFTLLHTASHAGELAQFMDELIALGADVKAVDAQRFRTPLFVAASYDDLRPMEVLLKHGADPNARDLQKWTPLMMSALGKMPAAAARLIQAGADPTLANQDGVTPMQIALTSGHPELIAAFTRKK